MFSLILKVLLPFLVCISHFLTPSEIIIEESEKSPEKIPEGLNINYRNVQIQEFIRFVSRICNVNFIYDQKELNFNVSVSSGKSVTPSHVLRALIQMLRVRGMFVMEQDGYFVIHNNQMAARTSLDHPFHPNELLASNALPALSDSVPREFMVYKLQYQQGGDVETAIKKIGADLQNQSDAPIKLLHSIQSLQWVKATNSILATGDEVSLSALKRLVESIDVPLKQVFIEVLVIETDSRGSLDFGLEWAALGSINDKLRLGMSNIAPARGCSPFFPTAEASGKNLPFASGFNLGVIGDTILHKGTAFLSLASLVSALETDGNSTIVLNQKIITQDNKNSRIFVGDNIPFTGSVVQTIGASQQTTSNIEYRDIGVSLSITPMLGDDDVITLEIKQEITEALPELGPPESLSNVGGIRTTKTDMSTQVHVPDQHFLVLTGMMRNHRNQRKTGIPCLGGLPVIGVAFSKNQKRDDKKNIIVYVHPQIIRSINDHKKITAEEEESFKKESHSNALD